MIDMKQKFKTPVAVLLAIVSVLHILFGVLIYNVLDYFVSRVIYQYDLHFFPRHITMFVLVAWILFTIAFNANMFFVVFKDKE